MSRNPKYVRQFKIPVNDENREFVNNQYHPSTKCNRIVFFDVKKGASQKTHKCKQYNLGHREIPFPKVTVYGKDHTMKHLNGTQ